MAAAGVRVQVREGHFPADACSLCIVHVDAATLKIKCVGRHCEPLQAVLCAAPIRAHPIAALPVLVAQLHEPEAILHAPDWLFLHTRYEHSVAALPDLQILVLWFQQVLQGQPCLMPFSTLCLVVAFDCLRVSKLKSLT